VADRVLSHAQYEELVRYKDGNPHWMFGGPPSRSLTVNGYLARVPGSGEDRSSSMFEITLDGMEALARYRERYGVPA
jgi:hypothetical protein